MDWRYDSRRQFYYRIPTAQLADRQLPAEFINRVRNKNFIECQTVALIQRNAKASESGTTLRRFLMRLDQILRS
jgi:DNA mismatch repair protein MSH4